MADREEKTYAALPRRRQQAREQGQIARSNDFTAAWSFLTATIALSVSAAALGRWMSSQFRSAMSLSNLDLSLGIERSLRWPLEAAVLVAAVLGAGAIVGATLQEGFILSFSKLSPDISRINPLKYFERLFSKQILIEIVKSLLKLLAIVMLGWSTAKTALEWYSADVSVANGLEVLSHGVGHLLGYSAIIGIAVAAIDYGYKKYEFERDLKMSRQEFMDELKMEEGNPLIKRAIRRLQRKNMHRSRGINQAAGATVVLTNPTHLAVALRYRRGFDGAPLVVAKGAGEAAHRITAIARMAAVPVLENKPLARALFKVSEVGDVIPRQFYRAIAEVLAMILRGQARAEAQMSRVA